MSFLPPPGATAARPHIIKLLFTHFVQQVLHWVGNAARQRGLVGPIALLANLGRPGVLGLIGVVLRRACLLP